MIEWALYTQCAYLSLDAFNSSTASLNDEPRRALARHKILVVFPVPGGPWKTMHNAKYIELIQKYQPHPETENKNYMFEKTLLLFITTLALEVFDYLCRLPSKWTANRNIW